MEFAKRSNFELDVTNTPVVIRKGLKAIDFIGAIGISKDASENKSFRLVMQASDKSDGTVSFVIVSTRYTYDPATGQITTGSN